MCGEAGTSVLSGRGVERQAAEILLERLYGLLGLLRLGLIAIHILQILRAKLFRDDALVHPCANGVAAESEGVCGIEAFAAPLALGRGSRVAARLLFGAIGEFAIRLKCNHRRLVATLQHEFLHTERKRPLQRIQS